MVPAASTEFIVDLVYSGLVYSSTFDYIEPKLDVFKVY